MRFGESRKRELWTTRQGHTFAATGTGKACHGTAILIHKRWTKHTKEAQHTGPRPTGVSIVKDKFRLQVSSVHFPHTGYGDSSTCNKCTAELQKHTGRSRKTNTHTQYCLAETSTRKSEQTTKQKQSDSKYIGRHALGEQNSRGQWLGHWAVPNAN